MTQVKCCMVSVASFRFRKIGYGLCYVFFPCALLHGALEGGFYAAGGGRRENVVGRGIVSCTKFNETLQLVCSIWSQMFDV